MTLYKRDDDAPPNFRASIRKNQVLALQIATDSGFGSSAYFSDRFRQHYGMSPSDYRTEAAKSGEVR